MPGTRLLRILAQLDADGALGRGPAPLCSSCARITATTGAGILLMSGDVLFGSVCTSDAVTTFMDDLQLTLGEGPCVDAARQDRPVLEADLAAAGARRWAAFTPAAVEAGARAVFAFPLRVGAARIGAFTLYRGFPGPLDEEQHADALVWRAWPPGPCWTCRPGHPPEGWGPS